MAHQANTCLRYVWDATSATKSFSTDAHLYLTGDIALCSSGRHFTLTVPLTTQVYKWVPANLTLGILEPCDGPASHPGGSRNTPNRFMPQKHCEGICVLCKTPEPVDSDLSSNPNCSARMGIQCTNHYAFVRIFFHDNCFYFQYRFTFRL